MGTGFPPFRGGLLRYADEVGLSTIRERIEGHDGARTASALLTALAEEKSTFYGRGAPTGAAC